jgi:hypothetical protein
LLNVATGTASQKGGQESARGMDVDPAGSEGQMDASQVGMFV